MPPTRADRVQHLPQVHRDNAQPGQTRYNEEVYLALRQALEKLRELERRVYALENP